MYLLQLDIYTVSVEPVNQKVEQECNEVLTEIATENILNIIVTTYQISAMPVLSLLHLQITCNNCTRPHQTLNEIVARSLSSMFIVVKRTVTRYNT